MQFRHEWKIEISPCDRLCLHQRLGAVMTADPHAVDGIYRIRSLYFDDPADTALREKLDGVNIREKFRIRYYNEDLSLIHLEKKSKQNGLCRKQTAVLTREQAGSLAGADRCSAFSSPEPLVQELCAKISTRGLRPKTIVDYTREAYVYGPGNVRVTLDYDIRTGMRCTDFLNPHCITVPVGGAPILLEVKWDSFLPDVIRNAIQLPGRHAAAFSKYAACRIYD